MTHDASHHPSSQVTTADGININLGLMQAHTVTALCRPLPQFPRFFASISAPISCSVFCRMSPVLPPFLSSLTLLRHVDVVLLFVTCDLCVAVWDGHARRR